MILMRFSQNLNGIELRSKPFFNNSVINKFKYIRKFFDLKYALRKLAFDDTFSISDLPISFHQNFLAGSHPFGITLSDWIRIFNISIIHYWRKF